MRIKQKKRILNVFNTIYKAHELLKDLVEKSHLEMAQTLLLDCQNTAIELGNAIEKSEGELFATVNFLSEYCEALYNVSVSIEEGNAIGNKIVKYLNQKLRKAENSAKNDICAKIRIVFFPYKASMWTSLESIWKVAIHNENCEVKVVPIPYCIFDTNMQPREWVCEEKDFPKYVPVISYKDYCLEEERPDIAFIHNAYDYGNNLTSVLPYFYSSNIKKYTDCLVYSPYFTFGSYNGKESDGFFASIGSMGADKIVVQSPFVANLYISYGYSRDRLIVQGSPKIDTVIQTSGKNSEYNREKDMPEQWKAKLLNREKIILLNTHWSYFILAKEYLDRGLLDFNFAKRYHEMFWKAVLKTHGKCGVIWRPHPLLMSALEQRCPELLEYINEFAKRCEESEHVVIDRGGSYVDAFNCSDAMVSTYSSLINEYLATGKPVQIFQSKPTEEGGKRSPIDFRKCYFFFKKDGGMTFYQFMKMVLENDDPMYEERMQMLSEKSFTNLDGTAGKKILNELLREYM